MYALIMTADELHRQPPIHATRYFLNLFITDRARALLERGK